MNVDERTRRRDCAEEHAKKWNQRYGDTPLGYVEDFNANPEWQEMGLVCPWEHCIENMPLPDHAWKAQIALCSVMFAQPERSRLNYARKTHQACKKRFTRYGEICQGFGTKRVK